MAETSVINLQVNTQSADKNVNGLKNQIRDYRNQLGNLDRGSKEYNRTLAQLASLTAEQNKRNRELQAATLNLTDVYSQLTSVVGGVAAGFSAFQSVSALLGSENERLEQTFVKLQASMAIVQSITSLSNAFKSLGILLPTIRTAVAALNATIAANPVVAFTVAVGGLVAALKVFGTTSKDTQKINHELADSYKALSASIKVANDAIEDSIYQLQLAGAKEADIINARRALIRQNIDSLNELSDSLYNQIEAIDANAKAFAAANNLTIIETLKLRGQLSKQREAILTDLEEFYDQQTALNTSATANERAVAINAAEDARTKAKAEYDNRIKQQKEFLQTLQYQSEDFINNILNRSRQLPGTFAEIAKNIEAEFGDENVQDRIPLFKYITDWTSAEKIEERRSAYEMDLKNLLEIFNNEELSFAERGQALATYQEKYQHYLEFQKQAAVELKKLSDAEVKQQNAKYSIISSYLGSFSSLLGETTAAGKAAAVTQATIDTYQAANSAYAALAGIPVVGPALGAAAAGAAIVSGIANVKSILSAGSNGASITPSVPETTSITTTPNLENVYEPTITPTVRQLQSQEERDINTRVYIVESDIQDSNQRVSVRESENTF